MALFPRSPYVRATALALAATTALGHSQTRFRTILGTNGPSAVGRNFANLGDVDGDGWPDIAFQRSVLDPATTATVEIVSVIDGRSLRVLETPAAGSTFGAAVEGIGDVNGDGFADVAIGHPNGDGLLAGAGRTEVRSGADGSVLYVLLGETPDERFGAAIAAVPDLDGDGAGEIAVGAWAAGPGAQGGVSVFSGATGSRLWRTFGPAPEELFGYALAFVDDLDGDGMAELAVGAPAGPSTGAGRVHLLAVSTGAIVNEVTGPPGANRFGGSVAAIGDANQDGHPDLLVGAPGDLSVALGDPGGAYLISGLDRAVLVRVAGPSIGYRVESAGDYNRNGIPDFMVDHPVNSQVSPASTRIYEGSTGVEIRRFEAFAQIPSIVRGLALGDLDGDQVTELVMQCVQSGTYDCWLGADAFQTPTCITQPANSSGGLGTLALRGSLSVAFGFAQLESRGIPNGSVAVSLASRIFDFVPGAGGGLGTLCLGNPIGRFLGPGQVATASASGAIAISIDLSALPQPSGPVLGMAGETWRFQTWYRDSSGGQATSNLTSATGVLLR